MIKPKKPNKCNRPFEKSEHNIINCIKVWHTELYRSDESLIESSVEP